MAHPFKSLKGHLLLDGGKLRGSFFHRSVVLICQHDRDGAFGLVLNRSAQSQLGTMLLADVPESLKQQSVYVGGPVQATALSYLYSDSLMLQANVMPKLSLGHSLESLVELCESLSPEQKLRVFAGYSGWGAGQLEDELKRDAWVTHPATLEVVFHEEPSALWQQVLRSKGFPYCFLADAPEDPNWN